MSLDTYANLQTAIANELHRSDLTSFIPDWITLAESRINKGLRVRQMETTQASTVAAGVVAVPTNYVELKDAHISSTSPYASLERRTANWIYDKYPQRTADRTPAFIAREGSNFIFGPYPDANYVVTLAYYNRFAALSTGLNAVFTSYPGLWLFGALAESAPWLKADNRVPMWEAKFKELLVIVQDESDDEYVSGSTMEMTPG